jgi:hypothetical protein
MRALLQKHKIGKPPLRSERPNLISIRRKPCRRLFWQPIQRACQPGIANRSQRGTVEDSSARPCLRKLLNRFNKGFF